MVRLSKGSLRQTNNSVTSGYIKNHLNEPWRNKYRSGDFIGTRVPVQTLFDYIETGETLDEFLENFPSVKKEFAIQVLQMAEKSVTNEKILNDPAISRIA